MRGSLRIIAPFPPCLEPFAHSVTPRVKECVAERRGSRRPELQAAWRKEARPELSWAVMEPRSMNQCRRAGRQGEGGAVGGVLGGVTFQVGRMACARARLGG